MKNKLYPTDVTDRQWDVIKELLPVSSTGRPRQLEMRQVLNAMLYNAMLYVVVGGIKWRMLPHEYPKWQSVYYYFRRWRRLGLWQRIHDTLRAMLRQKLGRHKHPTAGCLDSQSVKTTSIGGARGYDGGKQVKGRKRHVLVDTLGFVLAVVVTAASVWDPAGARLLLSGWGGCCKKLRRIWVDGTYRGTLLDWASTRIKAVLQPVLRREEHEQHKGFVLLPKRWIVERTFAWLGESRRLSKDYELLPASSEAMIHIAMIRIMMRRLAAN